MRATRQVRVGERDVIVKELTVGEIRAWLAKILAAKEGDLIDVALFDDVSLDDLVLATDLAKNELDDFSPSELREIVESVKELNSDFFAMRGRVISVSIPA